MRPAARRPPLLLLSDVDGTLLGDDGAWPASPAVLRARLAGLAEAWASPVYLGLASSRTLRELTVLQRALGLPGPCIAEDGARHAVDAEAPVTGLDVGPPPEPESHGTRRMLTWAHAASARELRRRMAHEERLGRADTRLRSAEALRALGFRTRGAIRRALDARTHSVLLDPQVWTEAERTGVRSLAAARGLHVRRGGRWFTLTTAEGKGPALCALRHQFTIAGVAPVIVAIGNEENDHSLLAEADCRFVVRNPHRGPHPVLSALPGAVVLDAVGIGGWMEMLDRLIPCAQQALAARASGATPAGASR